MPLSLRSFRRYFHIGYITRRSFLTNMLYFLLMLFTLSVVATQLTADTENQPARPPNDIHFDLHNQLQINRQRIVRTFHM